MSNRRVLVSALAVAAIATGLFAQSVFVPRKEDTACAFVGKALDDAGQLKPGMKRRDVEKKFELSSLTFRQKTVYVYRRCWVVHIDVAFKVPPGAGGDFSPEDEILTVSKPYLDYPTTD
jgi:hypothetical protein